MSDLRSPTTEQIRESFDDQFPSWAKWRSYPWKFMGWIPVNPVVSNLSELVQHEIRSDHGEVRESDLYPEGATIWLNTETDYAR